MIKGFDLNFTITKKLETLDPFNAIAQTVLEFIKEVPIADREQVARQLISACAFYVYNQSGEIVSEKQELSINHHIVSVLRLGIPD